MTGRRIVLATVLMATVFMATVACVPRAQADGNVLKLIPEDALAFVVINNLAEVDAKITALAERVGAPPVSPLAMLKATVGNMTGLDEKGRVVLLAMPPETDDAMPIPILIAPVVDYEKFIKQFGSQDAKKKIATITVVGNTQLLIAEKDGYVLVAGPGQEKLLEQVLDSNKSIAAKVAAWKKPLGRSDVAAVITQPGVKMFSEKTLGEMRKAKEMFAKIDKAEMKQAIQAFEMYELLIEAMAKETDKVALFAKVDKKGNVFIRKSVIFIPGGKAAAAVAGMKSSKADHLAGLPGGPYVLAGGGVLPEKLTEMMMQMSVDMMKLMPDLYGIDPKQADELVGLSADSFKGMKSMSLLMGVGEANDPLYSNMVGVVKVGDAAKFTENYLKYIKALNELVDGDKPSILSATEVEEITLDGKPCLHLAMKIPTPPSVEGIPDYHKLMEAMFGPGGKINIYMATADKNTIVWGYTDKEKLLATLKTLKDPEKSLANDKQLAKTAARLPRGSQWVGYVSPRGSVAFANRTMVVMNKALLDQFEADGVVIENRPKAIPSIPEFPESPPVGFSMKIVKGRLQADMVVPDAVIRAIGKYTAKLREYSKKAEPTLE